MVKPIDDFASYIERVTTRDSTWTQHARCKEASPEVNRMFTCIEEDRFAHGEQMATGLQVQQYVVDRFCLGCPVQWECARWACEDDEPVGAWAMTLRDRRWLMSQRNPLGIIDAARRAQRAISIEVQERRGARRRHPAMRRGAPAEV